MPRARHAMGRPGTAVFPADWPTTGGTVITNSLSATVALREPGTQQSWNPDTEQNEKAPLAAYYAGPAEIQAVSSRAQANVVVAAEDPLNVAGYQVKLDAVVDASEGHLVTVTDTEDPTLEGRTLLVREVERGSRRFSRVLFCTLTD